MQTIRIKFCDFFGSFDPENNDFIRLLRQRYQVELSDQPDFLFYSVFGYEHLRYHCVKIFFTGECIVPDFNLCDYAMGFDQLTFGDRYLRLPLYQVFQYRKDLETALQHRDITPKEKFCAFVVSNDTGMPERLEMLELLNQYKTVDSGGRYRNNVGGPVADKQAFQSQYKFSIAFENCSQEGYTTEKIVQSFAAGNIPIYYGNPNIAEEFNPKAFVNCHDFPSLEAAAERIREIDQNDALYRSMLAEPITSADLMDETPLANFLYHIFDQSPAEARRRPVNTKIADREEEARLYANYRRRFANCLRRVKALFRRLKNGAL